MPHAVSLTLSVQALETLASGRIPDRAQALAGALALDTLAIRASYPGDRGRELSEAAQHLRLIANGQILKLNAAEQSHVAELARLVRELAEHSL